MRVRLKNTDILYGLILSISLAGFWGCAGRTVTRIDPNSQIDLSGNWNDTDSRLVSEEMIDDCLKTPWRAQFTRKKPGKSPTIIAGCIRNESLEHISAAAFLMDIERAMVNSGQIQVAASSAERGEIREEKADQQVNASQETLKKMGEDNGADYMLIGKISQINDSEEGKQIKYYQVDLTLVDIQSSLKVWMGQKKIKKFIGQGKYTP